MKPTTGICSICEQTVIVSELPDVRRTSSQNKVVWRRQRPEAHTDSCREQFQARIKARAASVHPWGE